MDKRPFINLTITELRELAKRQWLNSVTLEAIERELSLRSTSAAEKLRGEVQQRLKELRNSGSRTYSEQRSGSGTSTDQDDRRTQHNAEAGDAPHVRAQLQAEKLKVISLERELENARAHIELLEREIAVGANGNAVFRKVGLSESCPEFVIKAVRTAYRKQLHPDGHPSHLKPEAERRRNAHRCRGLQRGRSGLRSDSPYSRHVIRIVRPA